MFREMCHSTAHASKKRSSEMDYNFLNELPPYYKNENFNDVPKFKGEKERFIKPNKIMLLFSKIKSFFSCSFFVDFCNETSIHGFNHIVAPRRHILEKLGWLITTILAGFGALQLCLEQWQRYVANPTVVALEKDYRNWNNTFMAVTICQDVKYSRDPEGFIKKNWGITPNDEKFDYYMNYVKIVANASMMNLEDFEPYKDDQSLKGVNMYDIAVQVMEPSETAVIWYYSNPENGIVDVMTDRGICHTINSLVSVDQAIQLSGKMPSKQYIIKDVNNLVHCSYLTYPCYLRLETKKICLSFYVHSPYEIMDVSTEQVKTVCTGEDALTDWSVVETRSSEDVKGLRIEQRKCRYFDEPVEKAVVYDVKSCRRRCRNKMALKLCGCKPFFFFQEAGENCDAAGMFCLSHHVNALLQPENCECQQQCEDASYEIYSFKEARWNGPLSIRSAIKVGMVAPRSRYRRQILFCFEDLVVSFGGAAGLFLGCSFLSGVEIVYFIAERFITFIGGAFFKRFFKKKPRTTTIKVRDINARLKKATQISHSMSDENLRRDMMKKYVNAIVAYDNFLKK